MPASTPGWSPCSLQRLRPVMINSYSRPCPAYVTAHISASALRHVRKTAIESEEAVLVRTLHMGCKRAGNCLSLPRRGFSFCRQRVSEFRISKERPLHEIREHHP